MAKDESMAASARIRLGAVNYVNSRPLVDYLAPLAPWADIVVDVPGRLADALSAGQLDAALVPSIEYARVADYSIVSDACVASDGPVRSVKLYGRVPIEQVRSLALDEGSRTSAALTRILLSERFGLSPELRCLPIDTSADQVEADAVMVIGDRGMWPVEGDFAFEWDLGEQWTEWTGLPMVFAMWIARPGVDLRRMATALVAARDEGLRQLPSISQSAAPSLGVSSSDCLTYLRDHLTFHLGVRQRQGLARFYELAARHGLAPTGVELVFDDSQAA